LFHLLPLPCHIAWARLWLSRRLLQLRLSVPLFLVEAANPLEHLQRRTRKRENEQSNAMMRILLLRVINSV
jgi:hypothetical protein